MSLLLLLAAVCCGCKEAKPVAMAAPKKLDSLEPGLHRTSFDVPNVGRMRCAVDIPLEYDGNEPVPLVLVLHYGYAGTRPEAFTGADMLDTFKDGLAELNAIVIAPDCLAGDWTTSHNEVGAVWLAKSMMETYNIDPKRVLVTGYSMGGEGAWHIAAKHQDLFTAAIPVAAPVAGRGAKWDIPVYVIHGEDDNIVSFAAAEHHANSAKAAGATLKFRPAYGLTHYDTPKYAPMVGFGVKWIRKEWNRAKWNQAAANQDQS